MENNLYCYTENEMAALVDGNVPVDEKAAFQRHILKCTECRREWIELKLAHNLPLEQPPAKLQELIKTAPAVKRIDRRQHRIASRVHSKNRSYAMSRMVSLIAATLLVAVVLFLVSQSHETPNSIEDKDTDTTAIRPDSERLNNTPKPSKEVVVKEEQKQPERKIESLTAPEAEKKVELAELPGIDKAGDEKETPIEKLTSMPVEKETPAERKLEEKLSREMLAEKTKTQDSKLEEAKQPAPREKSPVPAEKLAVKLTKEDADIFKKHYMNTLACLIIKEQEIAREAQKKARQFDPILGRPPGPARPIPPQQPKTEPKAEPKPETTPNPNAPPTLPRVDELKKEGKIPKEQPTSDGNPSTPPPLPRIDELRKEGKIPPANPGTDSKPDSEKTTTDPAPKSGPAQIEREKELPAQPKPSGPAKQGLAGLPEITEEELARLASLVGFEPVKVPALKKGVILASAETIKDSNGKKVLHLFYYFKGTGFSIFERATERNDENSSYQVHYNGKGKHRSIIWAADKREFIVFSHKLSKRDLTTIEKSIRDIFE